MGKKVDKEIIDIIKKFKEKAKVDKVILFGSYAKGNFTEHSDVDLILVAKRFEKKSFHSRFKGLWSKWHSDLPVDFIPFSPKEFKKLSKKVSIVSEALREGIEI